MNDIYRPIWNEPPGAWAAVSGTARGRGSERVAASVAPVVLALTLAGSAAALAADPPAPTQLPTGGKVVAGTAAISQAAAVMNVTQSTARAAIDWQTFNVGAAARVNFLQPSASSVTLNRVLDANPSQIFGQISANGQVFFTNPNGVYFSPSSSVDVGGFLATTHAISNADFMAGRNSFTRNGATGAVLNEGNLNAGLGGYIALLAPEARNRGVIVARLGTVALAAGEAYDLQMEGDRLAGIRVTPATIAALVENGNAVHAPGGLILLSAQAANALHSGVVNNAGTLEATGLANHGGTIRLEASDRIAHSGAIRADAAPAGAGDGGTVTLIASLANPASRTEASGTVSARGGDAGGDGGFIETSGATVKIGDNARFDTRAPHGHSGNWLIDPTDYTIAASGGNITGATLANNLLTSSVTIQSSSGGAGTGGDINVNDSVSWGSNTLTLTAARDVNINAVMTASGDSILIMNTATANGAASAVSGGTVKVGMAANAGGFTGRVDFGARSGTGFLTINNTGYTVINSLGSANDQNINQSGSSITLQGLGHSTKLAGKFALGANIDAAATSGWNANAGFAPIALGSNFIGTFDGLGHTISGLTINRSATNSVGLFSNIQGAVIRNVGLVGGSARGVDFVGGLVGFGWAGTISNSYATGAVTGAGGVGGLMGNIEGNGSISNSYATGAVTGTGNVGGLVGVGRVGTISGSYATGAVTGTGNVGGLVGGFANSTISNSYATGVVTGSGSDVGGLVGNLIGTISNSYATGAVTSGSFVGGLVGGLNGTISNSYATGAVSVLAHTGGGLVGLGGAAINSFWDITTTGQPNSPVGTGLTTAQMKSLASFASWNTATPNTIDSTGGSGATWRIYEGQTRPLLTAFMTPLALADTTVTFNGSAQSGASTSANGVSGAAATGTNVGVYNNSYYSSTQGGFNIRGFNTPVHRDFGASEGVKNLVR